LCSKIQTNKGRMRSAGVVKEIHKILHNFEIIRVLGTLSL